MAEKEVPATSGSNQGNDSNKIPLPKDKPETKRKAAEVLETPTKAIIGIDVNPQTATVAIVKIDTNQIIASASVSHISYKSMCCVSVS